MKDPLRVKANIDVAPLEISTQSSDLKLTDENGHYHHRKELVKIFNKPPASDVDHTQLFNVAKTEATKLSRVYCDTDEARKKFELVHGNIVGVAGQAGIGKTTLTKILVQKALNEGLYNLDYIFYIRFRDLDYVKKISFLQFLTNDINIVKSYSETESEKLLKMLENNERVGIILDGFDEAAIKGKSKPFRSRCSIYDVEKVEIFIKNLLFGNILPKAKKLITSRPRQLLKLHMDCRPKLIVNILGINKKGQDQICSDICKSEKSQMDKLNQYINDRPDLKGYCYVPINCILVMLCIHMNFLSSDTIAMDSITTILVATLGLFINNGHLDGEEFQIQNLCSLAYSGFIANRLYFEKKDLKKAKINHKNETTFLTASITNEVNLKLWDGIKRSRTYFSHLILQEFFVALHLFLFIDPKQLYKSLKSIGSSKFEMIIKFFFGLFNSSTLDYLRALLPSEILEQSHFEKKKEILKTALFDYLDKTKHKYDKQDSCSKLLGLSTWMYEMRDDKFTFDVALYLENRIVITGDILFSDIPALHYLLRSRNLFHVNLKILDPNVPKEYKQKFFSELEITLQAQDIVVSVLLLTNLL